MFERIDLAPEAQPVGTVTPENWKKDWGSRKAVERMWPKSHITLYSNVSTIKKRSVERRLTTTERYKGGLWVRLRSSLWATKP